MLLVDICKVQPCVKAPDSELLPAYCVLGTGCLVHLLTCSHSAAGGTAQCAQQPYLRVLGHTASPCSQLSTLLTPPRLWKSPLLQVSLGELNH